jgi:hypothetical protein
MFLIKRGSSRTGRVLEQAQESFILLSEEADFD